MTESRHAPRAWSCHGQTPAGPPPGPGEEVTRERMVLELGKGVWRENPVFRHVLGLCPALAVTNSAFNGLAMGLATAFVLVMSSLMVSSLRRRIPTAVVMTSVVVWFLDTFVLVYAPYLRLISYIVVIASIVQLVEMIIRKLSPVLFLALGIFLPLITTNCAILGLALFQTGRGYDLLESVVFALGAGGGLTLALVLMAGLREETELSSVPAILRGASLSFLIAGILSMAFMGFAGLVAPG